VPKHGTSLITTIAAGLVLAFGFGLAAHRLHISPLVGYLLAGIIVGPFTPGFVADQELANQLAEIGVILLLFAVGPALFPGQSHLGQGNRTPGRDRTTCGLHTSGNGPRLELRLGRRCRLSVWPSRHFSN